MKSIDDLITHYTTRVLHCGEEIDRVVRRYNAPVTKWTLEDSDVKRMCAVWEEERQIARDTVSWLETAKTQKAPRLIALSTLGDEIWK